MRSAAKIRCRSLLVAILHQIDGQLASDWAERLTAEFETIGAVLQASRERLFDVVSDQRVPDCLAAVQGTIEESSLSTIEDRPLLATAEALHTYLHVTMAYRGRERARVLHLTGTNILIRNELIADGTLDEVTIYIREVARRALELGSAAVILVHNHPSGNPAPSRHDIALTRGMVAALRPLGITVHDHLIIGASGHASLRTLGLI